MTYHLITMIGEIVAAAGVVAACAKLALAQRSRGRGISVIIPFRCLDPDDQRVRNFEWLRRYWAEQLPGAEVIVGEDADWNRPFSKSTAVNNGVAKSKGDILVVVDADGYIAAESVLHCAKEIREARKRDERLWFVPYRQFYRMTKEASQWLLRSEPRKPHAFQEPLADCFRMGENDPSIGHWYGAMIQIMPREAFEAVGGWDERFQGWGGEDAAALRAMDTLYAPHKTLPGQVLHVWHPQLGPQGKAAQIHWKDRMWEGQTDPGANDKLSTQYYGAYRKPERMRKLVDEGKREHNQRPSKGRQRHHHHRKSH
jgi:glycosyltransferase involved in cell wall biosynthesis